MGSNEVTSEAKSVLELSEPPFHHPSANVIHFWTRNLDDALLIQPTILTYV
jgi:hypothetical protein